MTEKVYKIKIVNVNEISQQMRNDVFNQVAKQPKSFRDNFKGFAKMTFVSASPIRFKSIEPIAGNSETFFNSIKEGVVIPSF